MAETAGQIGSSLGDWIQTLLSFLGVLLAIAALIVASRTAQVQRRDAAIARATPYAVDVAQEISSWNPSSPYPFTPEGEVIALMTRVQRAADIYMIHVEGANVLRPAMERLRNDFHNHHIRVNVYEYPSGAKEDSYQEAKYLRAVVGLTRDWVYPERRADVLRWLYWFKSVPSEVCGQMDADLFADREDSTAIAGARLFVARGTPWTSTVAQAVRVALLKLGFILSSTKGVRSRWRSLQVEAEAEASVRDAHKAAKRKQQPTFDYP